MLTAARLRVRPPAASTAARLEHTAIWIVAGGLGLWHFAIQVVMARTAPLGRYDDGFFLTTITDTLHGQLPITNFYQPYGIGLGFPGVLAHLVGLGDVFDLRVVYGLFPAAATSLAVIFVWRRTGWLWAVLVGLVSLSSNVPRYSMGFCALFAFALLVDRTLGTGRVRSVAQDATRTVAKLILAAAILSLAGWARSEYSAFVLIWAVIVAGLYRGPWRRRIAASSVLFAALPTLIILATGGATHLWWVLRYYVSSGPSGYRAQRGHPVVWSLFTDRLNELFHFQLSATTAGGVLGSYGVAFLVIIVTGVMLTTKPGRARLIARNSSLLDLFMTAGSAALLYFLAGSNWSLYASIGGFVFWAAAAGISRRITVPAALVAGLVVGYPLFAGAAPGAILDTWNSRLPTTNRPNVPNLQHIPLADDGGAQSMASLVAVWHHLGLDGKPVLSVELRNDVAWGVEAEVGYLLNAPAAAWPLAYDPGLVNRADVERGTVAELCANRAAVVQANGDYPYTEPVPVIVGSRILDEFLAVDYGIRGYAGFYRVLLPDRPQCVLPEALSDSSLIHIRDSWIATGQLGEAGAIAVALMDRARATGHAIDPADAAVAALGGYALQDSETPRGLLFPALQALSGHTPTTPLVSAAAQRWPDALEALAAQTAWIQRRDPGNPLERVAAQSVLALALRHPTWPDAISNASAVIPGSTQLFRRLAAGGAAGIAQFDLWRQTYFTTKHMYDQAIRAGIALVEDYKRLDDPLDVAQTEEVIAHLPTVSAGCARMLLLRARSTPGTYLSYPGPPMPCTQPVIASS